MNASWEIASNLYSLLLLSVAVWVTSTTIARARVFRPLRRAVKRRSDYLGEGVSCQFCVSHWVGFALAGLYQPRYLESGVLWVDVGISAFAIIGVANLIARTLGKTPPDGVLHPDEQSERKREAREALELERYLQNREEQRPDRLRSMSPLSRIR